LFAEFGAVRCIGSFDAMREFHKRDGGDSERLVRVVEQQGSQRLLSGQASAFCRDEEGGVKKYAHQAS
jgi:hypothetical protein